MAMKTLVAWSLAALLAGAAMTAHADNDRHERTHGFGRHAQHDRRDAHTRSHQQPRRHLDSARNRHHNQWASNPRGGDRQHRADFARQRMPSRHESVVLRGMDRSHWRRYEHGQRYSGRGWTPSHRTTGYVRSYAHRTQHWHRGARLPASYYAPRYIVNDYGYYGLRRPPRGHCWVRVNGDVVLAALASGVIVEVVNDLFY
jgi:Ni/Co efflux regulator RcnB